jgi:hypothetical protein
MLNNRAAALGNCNNPYFICGFSASLSIFLVSLVVSLRDPRALCGYCSFSALEWVIDRYHASEDKRSAVWSDTIRTNLAKIWCAIGDT